MPKRIQRKRTKGWRMPENTVSVCRPGRWGNPYKIGTLIQNMVGFNHALMAGIGRESWVKNKPLTREESLKLYKERLRFDSGLHHRARTELKGKDLACFCKLDDPCHADLLLEIANEVQS